MPDVKYETTDFFKTLVGDKRSESTTHNLGQLNPDQKKKVLDQLSSQKHFMLPYEIKQLKSALKAEELNSASNPLLIKEFSDIDGNSPLLDSIRGHKLDLDLDPKFSKSVRIDPILPNKASPKAVKNLPPKLKEIYSKNKNMLSKV